MPRRRGRPKREVVFKGNTQQIRPVKRITRFCFSEDGIYSGDGDFRWWQEYDDSGYGWSGQFDIIDKTQLRARVQACRSIGIPVYEKCNLLGDVPEHECYELIERMAGREDLL